MYHQLVDASQMLEEFENFYCNRNVHNVSRYEKRNYGILTLKFQGKGF